MAVQLCTSCMANTPDRLLGPVLWVRRQLAARGYNLVVVKEADWQEVDPAMRPFYLRRLMKEAGLALPTA